MLPLSALAAAEQPNIFIIWGDDIGISNISNYSRGLMGYETPNIDRIADNTIVFYSTDNGPHFNQWPDAAITPFRSEKNTNWEGGFRVPAMVRWPGQIPANKVSNTNSTELKHIEAAVA